VILRSTSFVRALLVRDQLDTSVVG